MCRKRNEKGNAYIEFVLVASFFFVPIILGMNHRGYRRAP